MAEAPYSALTEYKFITISTNALMFEISHYFHKHVGNVVLVFINNMFTVILLQK